MVKICNNILTSIFFCISITFILASCSKNEKNIPDTSSIDVPLDIVRTEITLKSIDTLHTTDALNQLIHSPDSNFYKIYFNYVLRVPYNEMSEKDKTIFMNGFVADQGIQRILYEVDSVYMDFEPQKKDFKEAFKFLKYYFPEKQTPKIYTYISEFSLQKFLFEVDDQRDGLAIGLDMYLGENYNYRRYVGNHSNFSDYLTRRYNRDHIVSNSMKAIVEDLFSQENIGETLLDKMIYNGKKLYILEKLLPYTKERILIEYTEDQWQWCEDNQQEMWAYFFKEDLFYSTDMNKIRKLVDPSPSSSGMPPESPGRTANYMGWQIIKEYMTRYPETTLQDLITLGESQKILEQSKFKPKRN